MIEPRTWSKRSTDTASHYSKMISCTKFRALKTQKFEMKIFQTIICEKHSKNCAISEKVVTTSKTLTEKKMKSCTTVACTQSSRWKLNFIVILLKRGTRNLYFKSGFSVKASKFQIYFAKDCINKRINITSHLTLALLKANLDYPVFVK